MLKNRKRNYFPYILAVIVLGSILIMAFLIFARKNVTDDQEFIPEIELCTTYEESEKEYRTNEKLPLVYHFEKNAYLVDIPQGRYEKTGSGVFTHLTNNSDVWIGEYETDDILNVFLDEVPSVYSEGYERSRSYADILQGKKGIIQNQSAEGAFVKLYLKYSGDTRIYYACIYEISIRNEGKIGIAVLTSGDENNRKRNICVLASQIKDSLRVSGSSENISEGNAPDRKHEDSMWGVDIESTGVSDKSESVQDVTKGLQQTGTDDKVLEQKEGNGNIAAEGIETDKKQNETKETGNKESESVQQSEAVVQSGLSESGTVKSSETENVEENSSLKEETQEDISQNESLENIDEPESSPVEPIRPAYNGETDLSVKSFEAPLTDIGMSISVTTGKYCPDTIVSLHCPDGQTMIGNSDGSGHYSFYLTAQAGVYTVTTSYFSKVESVNIDILCE